MQTDLRAHSVTESTSLDLNESVVTISGSGYSDYFRDALVEELSKSDRKDDLKAFLSAIDSKNFSSFTHDSRIDQHGNTLETTEIKSTSSTLLIEMKGSSLGPSDYQGLGQQSGFSAVVTLRQGDGSEVKFSVGEDEHGVKFENSDLRLVQLLRTYAHEVAKQARTDNVRANLNDLQEIDPNELEDVTFLSEQDFRKRFPDQASPSPLPVVAQARYRDMDVYVYQSGRKDGLDGVRYQLLASQDVMRFTGDLAEFGSSSSSLVRIEQGESSSLARLYQEVLRYDEKAEQTMKVLAEAEKLIIESLQKYAREIQQREAKATADESYFREIQRQFYVSDSHEEVGATRLLKVTLPDGGSTIGAVRIESEAGDVYPFELSAAASARVITQVNAVNSLQLPPEHIADPDRGDLGIAHTVRNRLRDFTAMSNSFNHLNAEISTLLKALDGQVVDYQSESFSDGTTVSEITRIVTADSVITLSLWMNQSKKSYEGGFVTVTTRLDDDEVKARNMHLASIKHPDGAQRSDSVSESRSGEVVASISFGSHGRVASADQIALLRHLRDSVEEGVTTQWNAERDFALRAATSLPIQDLPTSSLIEKQKFQEQFPGLIGAVAIDKVGKVTVNGTDVYVYQSRVATVGQGPRYEVLVSPTAASISVAVKEGVTTSRFPAWTTNLSDEDKEALFNKIYAIDTQYYARIEAQRQEIFQLQQISSLLGIEGGRIEAPRPKAKQPYYKVRCSAENYGEVTVQIPILQESQGRGSSRRAEVMSDERKFEKVTLTAEQTRLLQERLSQRLASLAHKKVTDFVTETASESEDFSTSRQWTQTVETNDEGNTGVTYAYSLHSSELGAVSVAVTSTSSSEGNVAYSGEISGKGFSSLTLEDAESRALFERVRALKETQRSKVIPKPRRNEGSPK